MTLVLIDLSRPGPDGTTPTTGMVECQPTARRVDGAEIVTPAGFSVGLVDGQATVELAASGPDWCWRITERTGGLNASHVRHVAVPQSEAVVEYSALVDVDPATLDPVSGPEAAWWVALQAEAEALLERIRAQTTITHLGDGQWRIGTDD